MLLQAPEPTARPAGQTDTACRFPVRALLAPCSQDLRHMLSHFNAGRQQAWAHHPEDTLGLVKPCPAHLAQTCP